MDNLRRTIASGVVGLAGLLGGCEGMSDQQALGLLLGGVAPYSKDPQAGASAAFLGEALVTADAAERSRSNIQQNVYVQPEGRSRDFTHNTLRKVNNYPNSGFIQTFHRGMGEINLVTCTYFEDFNKDGVQMFPEEYIGIKDKFFRREQVVFYFCGQRINPGSKYSLIVLDGSGNKIESKRDTALNRWSMEENPTQEKGYGAFETFKPFELDAGHYVATFGFDREFIGKLEIEVVE